MTGGKLYAGWLPVGKAHTQPLPFLTAEELSDQAHPPRQGMGGRVEFL